MTATAEAAASVAEPPRRWWQSYLDLEGAPAAPLLILFGLNLVDELDRIAFASLTPEIREAFDMSDGAIVAVGSVAAVLMLVGAVPLGYLGDRVPRLRIAGIAAVVWGSLAILTGAAWAIPVLFLARLGSGTARMSNEVVHPSLLADYYPPAVQPRVFQVHRSAQPLSYVTALAIGGLAVAIGWRFTFVVTAIPTFVLLALLLRLREPVRGSSVDPDCEEAPAIAFREARRTLFGILTLRRCWLGGFLLGIAFIANAQLLSLFFERTHGFDPFQRGVVQFTLGLGTFVGIALGAEAARRASRVARFERLTHVIGGSFLTSAVALAGMAVVPWAIGGVALVFLLGVGLGVYQPAYFPLVARIVPARVRTQAYGWTLLFAGCGALFAIPLAQFGERVSYRIAFGILAGIIVVGAAVVASAAGRVAGDIERADAR